MSTTGIEGVHLQTHNWGRTAKFLQALGYEIEFTTGDGSGMLRNGDGPYIILVEVPPSESPQVQLALRVPDAGAFEADTGIEVVSGFADTHYGTKEMTVRDPDGRDWSLQAPGAGTE